MEAKHSVLIIDDDGLSREVLSVLLEAEGYPTRSASSGEEALALLAALSLTGDRPQAILADLQMPGLAGKALAERLRTLCGSSTRLIVMSAGRPEPSVVASYDCFLRKPIDIQSLAQALKSLAQPESARGAEFSSPDFQILDAIVYAKLASATSTQHRIDLYRFFFADALHRAEQMRVAVSLQDEAHFCKEAHTLQGGCGMLGATQMRSLAASMEEISFSNRTSLELEALLDDFIGASERLQSMLEARWERDL